MGLERVSELRPVPTLSGTPVVSREEPDRAYKLCGGWYIATHSSTADKHSLLERIAKRLSVKIEATVTEPEEELLA